MVQIIVKRHKENSKSRRMRERGEHYAMTKVKCDADRLLARKIDAAFTKLSKGCSAKVAAATSLPSLRYKPSSSASCLPEVSIYRAGHRSTRKEATHIVK